MHSLIRFTWLLALMVLAMLAADMPLLGGSGPWWRPVAVCVIAAVAYLSGWLTGRGDAR